MGSPSSQTMMIVFVDVQYNVMLNIFEGFRRVLLPSFTQIINKRFLETALKWGYSMFFRHHWEGAPRAPARQITVGKSKALKIDPPTESLRDGVETVTSAKFTRRNSG